MGMIRGMERPACVAGIFLAAFFLLQPHPQARSEGLNVGLDSNYPPFSHQDKRGRPVGFDLEVAQALCAALRRPCEFVFRPLDGLLEAMREGDLDLLMGVSRTPERSAFMEFSSPYFRSRSVYIARPGAESFNHGPTVKIGVRKGSVQMRHALRRQGERAEVVADEFGVILRKLARGELDMILTNDLAGYAFLISEPGRDFEVLGEPLPLESVSGSVRIGVRKGATGLRDAVDQGIRDIRFSGAFGRINRNFFPYTLY